MTASNTSPGVYPSVSDYSDYVVATTGITVGVVGGATKGELSKLTISDVNALYSKLGKPVANDYGLLLAEQVLKAGGVVIYKRIVRLGTNATAGSSSDAISFKAKVEGTEMNGATAKITNKAGSGKTATFDLTITKVDGKTVLETITGATLNSEDSVNYIGVKLANSEHVSVAVAKDHEVSETTLTFAGGSFGASKGTAEGKGVKFSTITYDSTMNQGTIKFTDTQADGYFSFIVKDPSGTVVEELSSLSTDEDDSRYFVTTINNYSEYVRLTYDKEKAGTILDTEYVIGGGRDGISGLTSAEITAGITEFSNQEEEELKVLTAPGYTQDPAIAKLLDNIASNRDDCIAIIDPPSNLLEPKEIADWTNGSGNFSGTHDIIGSNNSACYAPWMTMYHQSLGANVHIPPSVMVAAVIVQNDKLGYPWLAPAGLTRGKIATTVTLDKYFNQSDRDILYGGRNCVNPIIKFYNEGIVVWGQKTMQRNSTALDRLNVVRLVKYLKNALKITSAYFVFEGSNQTVWDRWVLTVEPILEEIKNTQGLYDYSVSMGYGTTVSESNLVNHIMPGVIKLLPTQTAEIIPIDFKLYSGGIEFPED